MAFGLYMKNEVMLKTSKKAANDVSEALKKQDLSKANMTDSVKSILEPYILEGYSYNLLSALGYSEDKLSDNKKAAVSKLNKTLKKRAVESYKIGMPKKTSDGKVEITVKYRMLGDYTKFDITKEENESSKDLEAYTIKNSEALTTLFQTEGATAVQDNLLEYQICNLFSRINDKMEKEKLKTVSIKYTVLCEKKHGEMHYKITGAHIEK